MRLFIRIPTNDSVHYALVPWLAWAARVWPDADISVPYTYGYGVAWGRNAARDEFLASDATHLWFIDSDVIPPHSTDLVDAAKEAPIVAAPYQGWHETEGLIWHVYRREQHNGDEQRTYRPLAPSAWTQDFSSFHADAAGLGCAIIERHALAQIPRFHHNDLHTSTPTGEDFEFYEDSDGVLVVPDAACRHTSNVDLLELVHHKEEKVADKYEALCKTLRQKVKNNGSTNSCNI